MTTLGEILNTALSAEIRVPPEAWRKKHDEEAWPRQIELYARYAEAMAKIEARYPNQRNVFEAVLKEARE